MIEKISAYLAGVITIALSVSLVCISFHYLGWWAVALWSIPMGLYLGHTQYISGIEDMEELQKTMESAADWDKVKMQ